MEGNVMKRIVLMAFCFILCSQVYAVDEDFVAAKGLATKLVPELLNPAVAITDTSLCRGMHSNEKALVMNIFHAESFFTYNAMNARQAMGKMNCNIAKNPPSVDFSQRESVRQNAIELMMTHCFAGGAGKRAQEKMYQLAQVNADRATCQQYQQIYDLNYETTLRYPTKINKW